MVKGVYTPLCLLSIRLYAILKFVTTLTPRQLQRNRINMGPWLGKGRWKPGQSGNPKGPPPKAITTCMRELGGKDGGNEKIAEKLYDMALKGDLGAIREWLDRTEGKVVDKLQLEGRVLVVTADQLQLATQQIEADREAERLLGEQKQLKEG